MNGSTWNPQRFKNLLQDNPQLNYYVNSGVALEMCFGSKKKKKKKDIYKSHFYNGLFSQNCKWEKLLANSLGMWDHKTIGLP